MQGTGLIAKEIILLFRNVSGCSESFYEKLGNFSVIAEPKQMDVSRKSASQRALGNIILLKETGSQKGG